MSNEKYKFSSSSECPLTVEHIDQRFFTVEGKPNKKLQDRLQKLSNIVEKAFPNQEYTIYVVGGVTQAWKKKNYEGDLDILVTIPGLRDTAGRPVFGQHWYAEGTIAEKLFNLINDRSKAVRLVNGHPILVKGTDTTDINVASFPPFANQEIQGTSYYYDYTHQKWGTVEPNK